MSFQPEFTFNQSAQRVRFGAGIRNEIRQEVERLGCRRAVIVSTAGKLAMAQRVASNLGPSHAGILPLAVMHTPVAVTERAMAELEGLGADCLIAIGGGSAIGLGKALALRSDLPQVVLPTTYSGSEATAVLGQTEGGHKTTLKDARVLPEVILYDAELVLSLPIEITVASGLNAMAHAAEALYAPDRNPISTLLAIEGLRAFKSALPTVRHNPSDLDARGETLYGAWLCGTVLGQVGMALHHKLCHVLGGSFGLPHAQTHAVMLPYTIGFNCLAAADRLAPIIEIFGGTNVGQALQQFCNEVGGPQSLRELGMAERDLNRAAELALEAPYPNPRPLVRDDLRVLLRAAWSGAPLG
jgi:maleylacetate reductase